MFNKLMKIALLEAEKALSKSEVPIGAIIVDNYGNIISQAHNLIETNNSQLAHAEILAINLATKKLKNWRLNNYTIYVTLEPCALCMNFILQSRLDAVIFGASSKVYGYSLDKYNNFEIYNCPIVVKSQIMAKESKLLLESFFKSQRLKRKKIECGEPKRQETSG